MSTLTIELPDERLMELRRLAESRGVSVEELAAQGIESLLSERRRSFREAADFVLEKNAELYRRLAQ